MIEAPARVRYLVAITTTTEQHTYVAPSEAEAVSLARSMVHRLGVVSTSVEVEVIDDVSSFALRQFGPDDSDTGWRCWFQGDAQGVRPLAKFLEQAT